MGKHVRGTNDRNVPQRDYSSISSRESTGARRSNGHTFNQGYTGPLGRHLEERPKRDPVQVRSRDDATVHRNTPPSQARVRPEASEKPSPPTQPKRPAPPKQPSGGFKKYLKSPKGYVTLMLVILMVLGALHVRDAHGIVNAAVAVIAALVIDTFVALIQQRQKIGLSDGGIVTALIVALVLSTTASWYIVVLTTAVAILSKHFIKNGRKPIFNPAAFGLLVAIYVFHVGESWWGDLASLPNIAVLAVLITGYLITSRVNKFPQTFTFLAVYFAIFLGLGLLHNQLAADAFRNPIINSALFLVFFMMTDPPTSPAKYRHQAAFGAITAMISSAIYLTVGGLTYLLIGLLVANLWKAFAIRQPNAAAKRAKGEMSKVRVRGMDY